MKQGVTTVPSLPEFVPDEVIPESGSSTGSKRSLTAESKAGNDHSKRRRNNDNFFAELCEQGLRYAIDQVSYPRNLRHVFDLSVIDEKLWISYYDHMGVMRTSQPLNCVNDLPRFILLLKCMKDMSKGGCEVLEQVTRNTDHDTAPSSVPGDDSRANASSSTGKHCIKNANCKGATPKSANFMTQFSWSIKDQIIRFVGRLAQTKSHGSLGRVSKVFVFKDSMRRDVSVGNLMCRCASVLNDWDLSKMEGSKERTPNSRTGTRTFMASDSLSKEVQDHLELQHLERYDWESMFYVLIWIGCRYNAEGIEVNKVALEKWFTQDLGTLADNKESICSGAIPSFNEHYRGLNVFVEATRKLFQAGYNYKRDYLRARRLVEEGTLTDFDLSKPFKNETLNGHVTYKKLLKLYKSWMCHLIS